MKKVKTLYFHQRSHKTAIHTYILHSSSDVRNEKEMWLDFVLSLVMPNGPWVHSVINHCFWRGKIRKNAKCSARSNVWSRECTFIRNRYRWYLHTIYFIITVYFTFIFTFISSLLGTGLWVNRGYPHRIRLHPHTCIVNAKVDASRRVVNAKSQNTTFAMRWQFTCGD